MSLATDKQAATTSKAVVAGQKRKRSSTAAAAADAASTHAPNDAEEEEDDAAAAANARLGPSALAAQQSGIKLAASLRTTSPDALRATLGTLRRCTALVTYDEAVGPSDARVTLAQEFVEAKGVGIGGGAGLSNSEAALGVLDAWDLAERQTLPTLLPMPLFVLAQLLALLSAHQPTHSLGDAIMARLLPSLGASSLGSNNGSYWARLQGYLGSAEGRRGGGKAKEGAANSAASAASETLTLASIRLMLEMSSFAGGKYSRQVFEGVGWSMRTLPRLLNMRRKAATKKGAKGAAKATTPISLSRPDVRTLWILFLLSFLRGSSSLKLSLLNLGRDFLPAVLKGLARDPPSIVLHILTALHAGLLGATEGRVPRARVVSFFNEWTCREIVALYERSSESVGVASEQGQALSVADVGHHFLLALCTHRGQGVCFSDNGWYGRSGAAAEGQDGDGVGAAEEGATAEKSTSKIFNKILLGVLRALAPTRSLAQAELALGILAAAPELLGPFLDSTSGAVAATSLEPRPASSAWLGTAAFFGRTLALPLPPLRSSSNEDSTSADTWPAEPPPLGTILSATLPAPISRGLLQRGATHTCRLTRHASLVLLCRVLERLARVRSTFMQAADEIGEGTERESAVDESMDAAEEGEKKGGRWTARWKEVEKEARKRLPDLGAVVGAMHALSSAATTEASADNAQPAEAKDEMLLTEVCLRAVWLYHAVLPDATVSPDAGPGRLDVGRLLTTDFMAPSSTRAATDGEDAAPREGLRSLCQLHALRIVSIAVSSGAASGLSSGGAFDLFARASSSASSRSYFCLLLTVYVSSTLPLIQGACDAIFTAALGASVMFEHDPQEWESWRAALPGADAAVGADSGVKSATTELSEEQATVLVFLDECVQRCGKTHYRYAESSRKLRATHASSAGSTWSALTNGADETDLAASPLLSTLGEQLSIRLRKGLLDAASEGEHRSTTERMALLAFLNRLLLALVGAGRPIAPLRAMAVEVQESLVGQEANLVFFGETIIARLDAISSPPSVKPISTSNGKQTKHASFADVASPGELRLALRSSSRPLTQVQVAALLESIQRLAGSEQLLHELQPGQECIQSLSAATLLDVAALHCKTLAQHSAADASVGAVEAMTSAAVAMARLHANPADGLAMVQAILRRSTSHDIQARIFSHPALLEHLAVGDESFTTSTISLVTSSLDSAEATHRALAQPLVERLLELLDSTPASALVGQARELVPFFEAEALDRFAAILLRELTNRSQDRANAQACFGTLSDALASPRSDAARSTVTAHLGTLLDGLATLTDEETAAEVLAIIYRALAASTMSGLDQSEHPLVQGSKNTSKKTLVSSSAVSLDALLAVKHLPGADAALALALYRSRNSVSGFLVHLAALADEELGSAVRALPHAVHAALDVHSLMDGASQMDTKFASSLPTHLASLSFDADAPTAVTSCASLSLLQCLLGVDAIASALQTATPDKPGLAFQTHVFTLCARVLQSTSGAPGKSVSLLAATLLDRGLLWLVRRFAEDKEDSSALLDGIEAFTKLVRAAASHDVLPKPHLAEPVIEAAIKNRLSEARPMLLVAELSRVVALKTAARSQQVSSITSHALFRSSVTGEDAEKSGSREAIIGALHASIALDPARLCRPATMAALLRVYGATLSLTDRRIFEVFTLFEQQERASFASLASQWSPLSSLGTSSSSGSAIDAVMAMDPALAFATCAAFPRSRAFGQHDAGLAPDTEAEAGAMYDPLFVLSLVSTMLLQTGGLTGLQWLAMLRTNALGIVVCSLSSRASSVRAFAASVMARAYTSVRNAQFQEREHLLLVLDALRDSLPRAAEGENGAPPPPPLTTTLFIAHALRSLSAPSSFTYPIFARFLLQRAELDTGDVPLLYNMLLSSSDDQHRQERLWMLRFLRDCLRSGGRAEWRVFKRRHAWELLASLYASASASQGAGGVPVDRLARGVIEDIFLAAAALPNVAYELLQRRALAPWVLQQIVLERSASHAPRRVWMELLDRALTTVDLQRLDRGTDGTWTSAALDAVGASLALRLKHEATPTLEETGSLRHATNVVNTTLSHLRFVERTLLDVGVRRATVEKMLDSMLTRVATLEELDGLAPAASLQALEEGSNEEQTEQQRKLIVARSDLREAVHQVYQATLALWHAASLDSSDSEDASASLALFQRAVRAEVAWGGEEARKLSVRFMSSPTVAA